jgi:hypothetical protein
VQNFKATQRERYFSERKTSLFPQNLSKATDVRQIHDLKNKIIYVCPTLGLLHWLDYKIRIIKAHKPREKEAYCYNLWRKTFSFIPDWSR